MRCGCGCGCVVQSGSSNVEVTGVGTPASPYRIAVDASGLRAPAVHVFHHPGVPSTSISDDFPVMFDGIAYLAQARLTVAGTTDTIIDVLLNGAVMGTITIPAGDKVAGIVLAVPVSHTAEDYFNVQATTVGDGSSGLWTGVYV